MTAVPDDKQGVASAVNDTTREVGAALGIALAGSMLAAQYSSRIAPSLTALPGPVRDATAGSLAEALEVARRLGPQGAQLTDAARLAFLEAFQSVDARTRRRRRDRGRLHHRPGTWPRRSTVRRSFGASGNAEP